ncbi:MAG: hypothetical protein LBQ09_11110 [Acidobacteriaceae bacterium]|nr:hypothetical protein [Acidobacteriaceae bacterium]
MKVQSWFVRMAVAVTLALAPIVAAAQTAVSAADAASFIGSWTLSFDSPQGPFEQTIDLKNNAGKVAATMTSPFSAEPQALTDISKAGANLVLRFAGDFQGQSFTAAITLTPDGDGKVKANLDIMDGMFVIDGTGVKK